MAKANALMKCSAAVVAAVCSLMACGVAVGQSTSADEAPEVIVVTGRLPGPPLWRVSNGDNMLWIFAMPDQVPEDMEWDSTRVEKVLAESEEYILAPGAGVVASPLLLLNPVNVVRGLRLWNRLSRNPDGKELKDVLQPDVYQRYLTLKAQYFPKDKDIEELRPTFAMEKIRNEVVQQKMQNRAGLSWPGDIHSRIRKLAARNKTLTTTVTSEMIELKGGYRETADLFEDMLTGLSPEKEQACFEHSLAQLEQLDLSEVDATARVNRAKAWAQGHVDEFRDIVVRDVGEDPCETMLAGNGDSMDITALRRQAEQNWVDAVTQALTNHHTSFAVLGINELLDNDGLLSRLREKGYSIREPD